MYDDGMKKEIKNTDKIMVSGRIPLYVKLYCEKKNIKISEIIMKGFDTFRETDKEHALNRLDYHEKRVLHWKHIVLQQEEESNTKYHICNTIKKDFRKAGRGQPENKRYDMSWIQAKAKHLIDEGIMISPQELYEYCTRGEK